MMTPRRLAVISVHTSPLAQPGTGDGGGLNVYVRETARRLAQRGVTVDVFTHASGATGAPIVRVGDRLTYHHVDVGPPGGIHEAALESHLCAYLLGLEAHVSARRLGPYDLIHAHYWMSGWVARRLRRRWGVPLIQSFHTLARVKNQVLAGGESREPELRVLAEDRLVRDADRVLVSVPGEAIDVRRQYPGIDHKMAMVRPGVDTAIFRPSPRAPRPREPLLLFVGRLQPLKGPDLAVRVLAEVVRSEPTARLAVIGGPSGRTPTTPAGLRELARRLGVADRVTFVGALPQQDLADWYRAASVLLVPSRTESFGLVALEAQACGTPIVAADVGGLRSVVVGGALVPGHEPEAHARAVVRLLRDEHARSTAIAAGLTHAGHASWESTVDGLLRVYDEVTARGTVTVEQGIGA